ncbi:uncharacterized protein PHALS_13610 [Plasmopara halstedii]|uniref:Uncharacterized protein n=1 Tax=Plasmopara halstedii TaxID=4781 RepID=A0A0P1AQR8_PLAHL|nr:uncharacterized protein PHALS_13610 [Plasmopara halstedii]CEG43413.1 hypothetical protein PHALS_13610 [Plasmopara halstedii]|eukprot:XP_024579782.1 hypothetical protein PHALS_13610 [Plasmopara halstedii]
MHALKMTTNRRVAKWFNELAEFEPLFKWIPGENNTVADALSRNLNRRAITKPEL